MNRPVTVLPVGTRVRSHDPLDAGDGLHVEPRHLHARRAGASGTVSGMVHGGEVYLVQHPSGGEPAAYCYSEIELEDSADSGASRVQLAA